MFAHAGKTLHWKISGNINDTDTFFPYPFLKNVIFRHEFVHKFVDKFFMNFVHELKYEIRTNSCNSYEFFSRKIGYVMEWPVLWWDFMGNINSGQLNCLNFENLGVNQ